MDFYSLSQFEEVRLAPAAACRAWSAAHGCYTAFEWNSALLEFPAYRQIFEIARLQISEALSVDGIDPLGIVRKLLIHESTASLSRSWLREVGFVHLEAASGIHLYCIWRSLNTFLRSLSDRMGPSLRWLRVVRGIFPLVIWFSLWALAGFRPGLIRPLILVSFRWATDRFGVRWLRGVPLLGALAVDAGFGFLRSYGSDFLFSEWAPGELHYALSWWGGIYGYEWARARGLGTFSSHAALSFFSWVGVLPVDLWEGKFAVWTPLLSLITVEAFVRGGYACLVFAAIAVAVSGASGLQWLSFGWNAGIGALAALVSEWGGVRGW